MEARSGLNLHHSPEKSVAGINEGHLGTRLGGPEIVRIERIGSRDDLPYLVLEYCPGGRLAERLALAPGGLPLADVFAIERSILRALRTAHEADVVHLDVKPSNVLGPEDGLPPPGARPPILEALLDEDGP